MTPTFTWHVYRNHTGRLSVSLVPQDETVRTFDRFADAVAYRNEQNETLGWRRELAVATDQARAA